MFATFSNTGYFALSVHMAVNQYPIFATSFKKQRPD
jgi:hypothetical protein